MILTESVFTDRFVLRSLTERDATATYLSWIAEPSAQKYISNKSSFESTENLISFIQARNRASDALLMGIFDKKSSQHIGNIKYEPISTTEKYAVMGILIGDVNFRGMKVGPEVIIATAEYLKKSLGILHIYLGVKSDNLNAVKAYRNMGFVDSSLPGLIEPGADGLCLRLSL